MFNELKIVELASVLAGPSVGQFFAELGAEVIKVENPNTNGDVTRSWKVSGEDESDVSAYFSCTNWGKKSLSLDIRKKEGLEIVHKLTSTADIVLTSYKPGDAVKLQVDFETLKKIKPDLIYGEITGYGSHNPNVGYDAIIQAEAGFMFINGQMNGPPTKMPVALMDILAGHQLKEAVLLAIIHKMKTGDGKQVSVSLIDTALASLANQGSNYLNAGINPERKGSLHPNIAPYGEIFNTKDEKQLLLAIGNNKQFVKFCKVLNLADLPESNRFKTNASRVSNRQALYRYLDEKIRNWYSGDLMTELRQLQIPAGIIASVAEALRRPEIKELLMSHGTTKGVKNFISKGFSISSHITPPPSLGEHTAEILRSKIGLNVTKIKDLAESGVV